MRRALVTLAVMATALAAPTVASAQTTTLYGFIQGGVISLRDAGGNPVAQVTEGTYRFEVVDSDTIHNFHLAGTAVSTPVGETGTFTFEGVVLGAGSYTYLCDVHPELNGTLNVTGSTPPPPPPGPPPPGSTLHGSIVDSVIKLEDAAGNAVTRLAPGAYKIHVTDQDTIHNFHLLGTKAVTSVEGRGMKTFSVQLVRGRYKYLCDAHPELNGGLTVGKPTSGPPARIRQARASAGAPRRVVVTLVVDRRTSARVRLIRNGRALAATREQALRPGLRRLRISVPAGAAAGAYRLRVTLVETTSGRRFELQTNGAATELGRDGLEHPLGDVEVRVDVLDVVVVLERVDQAEHLLCGALVLDLDRGLGQHRHLGRLVGDPR